MAVETDEMRTEPRVDRDGQVWLGDALIGDVEKAPHRGHTNKIGWRWFPSCLLHGKVGYDHGYETRKRAVAALMAHRRPWFRKKATLTADGHEPYEHTSQSQSDDDKGAADFCAQTWLLGRPDRRGATNISVTVETIGQEDHG